MSTQALASLVVSLEAQTAQFTSGMTAASAVTQKAMDGIERAASVAKTALAGIVSGFSVAAVTQMVKSSIDFADSLNDLSQKTGIAVETLGGLGYASQQSGSSLEGVAVGVGKLAQKMADAAGGGAETSRMFKALGVSATDASGELRSTDAVLFALADRFAGWEDGPEKAALAVQVFGKSGADMIPVLNEGGEKLRAMIADYQKYSGVTTDTAARADAFNDTLGKIHMMQGALGRSIASALLPTLQAIADVFVEAKENGTSFAGVGDGIAVVLKGITVTAMGVVQVVKSIGTSLGAVAAVVARVLAGDWKGAVAINKMANEDLAQSWAKTTADMERVWSASTATIAAKSETNMKKTKAPIVDVKEATKSWTDELDKLLNTLENRADSLNADYYQKLELLNRGLREGKIDQERYDAAAKQLFDTTKYGTEILRQKEAAQKAAVEADKEGAKWMQSLRDAYDKMIKSADDLIDKLQFEAQALTMTNAERQVAIGLRELERMGIAKGSEEYEKYASAIAAAVETKDHLQSQIEMWTSIEATAHATFTNILEGGSSVFKKLGETLKAAVYDLLYQITIKRWIVSIAADVTGNPAILGGASAGSGLIASLFGSGSSSGILGTLGNLFSLGGASFGSSFATSNLGQMLGLSTAASAADGGFLLTSLGSTLAPVISSLPWAALAAIAVPMITKLFDKGDAMRTGVFASNNALGAGNPLFQSSSAFGSFGVFNDKWFSDSDMGPAMQSLLTTIKGIDNAIASAVGPSLTAQIKAALQSGTGYDFGMEHTDLNSSGVAGAIIKDRYAQVLAVFDARLGAVMAHFEGTGDELGKFILSLINLDSATKNIPERIRDILFSALDGTQDVADKMLAFAGAYGVLQEAMNSDPVADALLSIARADESAYAAVSRQGNELLALAAKYDGTTDASKALGTATLGYYQSVVQMIAGLERAKTATSAMFADSQRFYQLDGMDAAGKIAFLSAENAAAMERLAGAIDPNTISDLARRIDANQREIYGLLTPDEQAAQRQQFINDAARANELAQQRFEQAQQQAQQQYEAVLTELRGFLDAAAAKIGAAADKQGSAADKIDSAGDKMLAAAKTPVTVRTRTPSDVNA